MCYCAACYLVWARRGGPGTPRLHRILRHHDDFLFFRVTDQCTVTGMKHCLLRPSHISALYLTGTAFLRCVGVIIRRLICSWASRMSTGSDSARGAGHVTRGTEVLKMNVRRVRTCRTWNAGKLVASPAPPLACGNTRHVCVRLNKSCRMAMYHVAQGFTTYARGCAGGGERVRCVCKWECTAAHSVLSRPRSCLRP